MMRLAVCMMSVSIFGVVQAQDAAFMNVVRIQTFCDSDTTQSQLGYGFVIAERNDTVFIATARHLVSSSTCDAGLRRVELFRYGDTLQLHPTLVYENEEQDLAILHLAKSRGISWEWWRRTTIPQINSAVWVVGNPAGFTSRYNQAAGTIVLKGDTIFHVDALSADQSSSGSPVLMEDKIIGMVLEGGGRYEAVIALRIDWILARLYELLGTTPTEEVSLPYVEAGVCSGIPLVFDTPGINIPPAPYYGIYAQIMHFPPFAYETSLAWQQIDAGVIVDGVAREFNNNCTVFRHSLQWYQDIFSVSTWYGAFSFAYIHNMRPKIKHGSTQWVDLGEFQKAEPTAGTHAWLFEVCAGYRYQMQRVSMSFETAVGKYTTKYLSTNLYHGSSPESGDDWALRFSLKVGFIFFDIDPTERILVVRE